MIDQRNLDHRPERNPDVLDRRRVHPDRAEDPEEIRKELFVPQAKAEPVRRPAAFQTGISIAEGHVLMPYKAPETDSTRKRKLAADARHSIEIGRVGDPHGIEALAGA